MPQHRSLALHRFLRAIGPDLTERFFLRLFRREQLPDYLVGMNPDYVFSFLDRIEAPLKAMIMEDMRRVNDVCHRGMDLPVTLSLHFGVAIEPGERPEALAMRLFLDHPHIFSHAWALYSYRASWANISQHWLQHTNPRIDQCLVANLTGELETFFKGQARGDDCQVNLHDEGERLVVLVVHGSQLRTLACWQGHDITINCFRPACEDVLIYDKRRAVLSVKTSTDTDREYYIRSFAKTVLGDVTVVDDPERDLVFTLSPLQKAHFDWAGNGSVDSVELLEAKLRLPAPGNLVLHIGGGGIETASPELASGTLIEAKLRFTLMLDGKSESSTFTIAPPCVTDLVKKRHADLISEYLMEKGVLLR